MEGKIEEERKKEERKKKERRKKEERKKNCQAHVTVLRTCSMSLGGVYVRHLFIRLYVIGATNDGVRRGHIEKQMSFYYCYFVYRT